MMRNAIVAFCMKRGIGVLFLLAGANASGQNLARLAVPVMGHLLDPAVRQVRPVFGIPGAALIGAPLDLGAPVLDAAFPPSPEWFLTALEPDRKLLLWRTAPDGYASRPLDAASPAPDRIHLSPSGSSAAFYYRSARTIEVAAGLPEAPFLARRIDVSAWNEPGPLAVSDDGSAVLASLPEMNLLAVFTPERRLIPLDAQVTSLAFSPGTTLAAAAAGSSVYLLRQAASAPALETFHTLESGGTAAGSAFSNGGSRLLILSLDGTIHLLDVLTGGARRIASGPAPVALQPFAASLFRLNDPGERPVLLLDAAAPEPRILFLPVDHGANQ